MRRPKEEEGMGETQMEMKKGVRVRFNLVNCLTTIWCILIGIIVALTIVSVLRFLLRLRVDMVIKDLNDEILWRIGNDTSIRSDLAEGDQLLCDRIEEESIWRIGNDTDIRVELDEEITEREEGDEELSVRIEEVALTIGEKIRSINGVLSESSTMDISITIDGPGGLSLVNDNAGNALLLTDEGVSGVVVGTGSGLSATKDGSSNVVTVDSSAVLTVEGQQGHAVSKNIDLTGMGGISVTTMGAASNEVIVNGGVLENAINNLNMENQQQFMSLSDQQSTDEDLQIQINALELSGQMLAQALNGTTFTFDMTLMELMATIYMLKDQVMSLQDEVDNLDTSNGIPVGTIVPYGGQIVPMGYLKCDGSKYLITNYVDLHSIIGQTYCTVTSLCTMSEFAVPDMRGRTAVGMDPSMGAPYFGTTGEQIGAVEVTLSELEMPSHSHTLDSSGSHIHSINQAGLHSHTTNDAGTHTHSTAQAGSHVHTVTVGSSGNHNHDTGSSPYPSAAGATTGGQHTHGFSMASGTTTPGTGGGDVENWNSIRARCMTSLGSTCTSNGGAYLQLNKGGTVTMANAVQSTGSDHSHNVFLNNDGAHTHGTFVASGGQHSHSVSSDGLHSHTVSSDGQHTHVIASSGTHTHTAGNSGGDQAHLNIQPSLTVGFYAIKY